MSRGYLCKKCSKTHMPPTGKKCTQEKELPESTTNDEVLGLLAQLKQQFDGMQLQMESMQAERNDTQAETQQSVEDESSEQGEESAATGGMKLILRSDVRAMERAARRIARFKDDDSDDSEEATTTRPSSKGKKSGSLLVAADKVKKVIDWPHMHVSRLVNGQRVGVTYKELRIEEFVYGFLEMLDAPDAKWDRRVMLQILKMLMQDAMDFSWANARGFYGLLGVDVESGTKSWNDTDTVRDMRMIHSRAVFPAKIENKDTKKAVNGRNNNQNLKCCALYQKKACEQGRDHPPFSHACSYCARTTGVSYRHPEEDCFRKSIDEAKNLKKRE